MCTLLDALFTQHEQRRLSRTFTDEISACCDVGVELTGPVIAPLQKHRVKNVIMFFNWVAEQEVSPFMSTYATLIAMYLSPSTRQSVINNTRPDWAQAYFSTFDQRMESYILGSSTVQSKPPPQIILEEWLVYTKITHRFP